MAIRKKKITKQHKLYYDFRSNSNTRATYLHGFIVRWWWVCYAGGLRTLTCLVPLVRSFLMITKWVPELLYSPFSSLFIRISSFTYLPFSSLLFSSRLHCFRFPARILLYSNHIDLNLRINTIFWLRAIVCAFVHVTLLPMSSLSLLCFLSNHWHPVYCMQ